MSLPLPAALRAIPRRRGRAGDGSVGIRTSRRMDREGIIVRRATRKEKDASDKKTGRKNQSIHEEYDTGIALSAKQKIGWALMRETFAALKMTVVFMRWLLSLL
jgi:hypothetical protein